MPCFIHIFQVRAFSLRYFYISISQNIFICRPKLRNTALRAIYAFILSLIFETALSPQLCLPFILVYPVSTCVPPGAAGSDCSSGPADDPRQ